MKKSLVPLIIILALVIIITILMINTDLFNMSANPDIMTDSRENGQSPGIRLSRFTPYSKPSEAMRFQKTCVSDKEIQEFIESAYQAYRNGKKYEAEDYIRTVLVFAPDDNRALALMGKILYEKGKFREAEAIFRKQAKLDPGNAEIYNNLGQALVKQKKYDMALASLSVAEEKAPDSPVITLNLSCLYAMKGEKEKSLKLFRKAFDRLGYEIIPASFNKAFDNLRDEKEFRQILDKAVKQRDALHKNPGK